MEAKKVLSPAQIAGGSFWGGPIATVYYLRKNYLATGNKELAQKALLYGTLFIIFMLGLLPFLPEKFPNMALPLAYCLAARQIAKTTQLKKEQIEGSEEYTFESNWKIFGVGILTMLIFLILAIAVLFVLDAAGIAYQGAQVCYARFASFTGRPKSVAFCPPLSLNVIPLELGLSDSKA